MTELLGYYPVSVPVEYRLTLTALSLEKDLQLRALQEDEREISFRVRFWEKGEILAALDGQGIPYAVGEMDGLAGSALKYLQKPVLVVGSLLALCLCLLLSNLVWEVRIVSGNEIDEDTVLSYLSACGLSEGVWRHGVDVDEVCAAYLLMDPDTAFLTVHMRGTVAEVELIPKNTPDPSVDETYPAHMVASTGAVIQEVRVYRGKALVKVGETVAPGDLLVTGIVTTRGGTRLLHAEAEVLGRVSTALTVTVPLTGEQTVIVDTAFAGCTLTVFGYPLTVGKGAGDLSDRARLYLWDEVRLPLTLTVWREATYGTVPYTRTEEEATRLALAELNRQLGVLLSDGALVSREMAGQFRDGAYILTCYVVYDTNIAKSLAFSVDNQ